MSRLVIISNRTADPKKPRSGGLAVALWSYLKQSGGLWIGWNGNVKYDGHPEFEQKEKDGIEFFTTELTKEEYENFYIGYSNSVLWPVFHNRTDLAIFNREFKISYENTIRRIAENCVQKINQDDIIWVHDYQMISCGIELRKYNISNRLGFFLHIPFPSITSIRSIPDHRWLVISMLSYDVIGFQTETDLHNFKNYVAFYTNANMSEKNSIFFNDHSIKIGVFPIGIDINEINGFIDKKTIKGEIKKYKNTNETDIIIGVDRLDYTKGIPQRIRSMSALFEKFPEKKKKVSLLQIASPSREQILAYKDLSQEVNTLSGKVNSEFSEVDWTPIHFIRRNIQRDNLPSIYRESKVALITPLCDGMNLVAKEYIASQDPEDPGVLILSEFAGASKQFTEALLVNPHDIDSTVEAIYKALNMPLEERKKRYNSLMNNVTNQDVYWWCNQFLDILNQKEIWLVA